MKSRFTFYSFQIIFTTILLCFASISFAQQNVGIGTLAPDPSAILHLESTEKGFIIPRMKKAERQAIVSPATGIIVYDTDFKAIYQYDGSAWIQLIDESSLPKFDKIRDADNDTWIDVERFADDDKIHFRAKSTDLGFIDNRGFQFQSPGNSLFLGDSAGIADDLSLNENVFIGRKAGLKNINGSKNLFIGNHAGEENLNGLRNIFAGYNAGMQNQGGDYNIAIGNNAGIELTAGNDNVVIGDDAGRNIGTGSENVYLGSLAGRNNVDSSFNVMIGARSGLSNIFGKENVFIGNRTGQFNSGSGNVFIGNKVGESFFGNDNLAIDNSNTLDPLLFGNFNTDELTVNGQLIIRNNYRFPEVDGLEDQVLSTDGSGILNWVNMSGGSGHMISDNDTDTKIQVEESPDEDKIRFDLMGTEAMMLEENANGMTKLILNPSGSSILIGNGAGEISSAGNNVMVGFNAGLNTTNGSGNTMLGSGAGTNNTTGGTNTFLGTVAGSTNTDGVGNTYIGSTAGLLNNGTNNVMIGAATGSLNQSGDRNTYIGVRAGQTGNSADGNVKLGYEAGLVDGTSNKLYIDNSGTSSPLIYGDFFNDRLEMNGWLGVNTTPNSQFHVNAPDSITAARIQVNGLSKFLVNPNGGVTIGSNSSIRTPDNGLYVSGSVNLGNTEAALGYKLSVNGKVICEELRVEDSGDWPDYVFEENYELQSLMEVEQFILEEGHLPNIPSAKEVQGAGFETGDMIRKLLEKIEELTLHTLAQQKQIDALKEKANSSK